MHKHRKKINIKTMRLLSIAALCFSSIIVAEAATLGQRAVYKVNIVVETDPTSIGLCSSFDFGDASLTCGGNSKVTDNTDTNPGLVLSGGNGVLDGFAGVFEIQTGKADALGDNTFTLTSFQMDPYLATAGGTFKTSMTAPDAANNSTGGVLTAAGGMTLDVTGRTGVAASFVSSIGIQQWNVDDATSVNIPSTGVYEPFTTGTSVNYFPAAGGAPGGVVDVSLTGRAIGDANSDGTLDAILVSAGNIGTPWQFFEGTGYSEIYNVQFVLVSADPVAVDDTFSTQLATDLTININNELIVTNDTIADPAETLSFVSIDTTLTDAGSTVTELGGIITYTPNPAFTDPSTDSFTYTITDGNGDTDTATVNITITNAGAPIANDDAVAAIEDTSLTFDPVAGTTVPGVQTDSDIPAEIANLTISTFDAVSGQGGTITQNGNDLTYTPAPNFNGVDTFTYTIQNSIPLISTATVTVTVAAVNDAPVCSDVDFSTGVDASLDINIANDLLSTTSLPPLCTDVDGDAVSLASFDSGGSNGGTITNSVAGILQYTPALGFTGAETFAFTATDGVDNAVPNTVTVNVFAASLGNFTMLEQAGNVFGGTNDVVFEWDEFSVNNNTVDVNGIPTDTNFGLMTIASSEIFFNFNWDAHHVRVFRNTTAAPITFKFDVTCLASDYDNGDVSCGRPLVDQNATQQYLTMTLQPGEIGAHILFDWGSQQPTPCGQAACNIDVVNVWKENDVWDDPDGSASLKNNLWLGKAGVPPALDASWRLVSKDVNGDGVNGTPMIDGAFVGYYANFNYKPDAAGEALPPITTEIDDVSASFSMEIWSLLAGLISIFGFRRLNNKQ